MKLSAFKEVKNKKMRFGVMSILLLYIIVCQLITESKKTGPAPSITLNKHDFKHY